MPILLLILLAFFALPAKAAPVPPTFNLGPDAFLLDNQPFVIRCGEIHFARVPRAYWRHRLQLCKAMGLNTVCAYLFWNYHEEKPGTFDWSGEKDVAEFCRIAQEEGLWVILRPGAYACAEWEMGGFPWWLLKKDDIKVRTLDPDYMTASTRWLKEVGRVLAPLQVTHGGPIILVQIENEYGFYGAGKDYMRACRQAVLDADFDVPLFTCNPPDMLGNGLIPELLPAVNLSGNPEAGLRALRKIHPTGPQMVAEFYPGWFDSWGFGHHTGTIPPFIKHIGIMLDQKASFSIYMAHGGTTFGLWAGSVGPKPNGSRFKPDTSSYDYDAPISEAGWVTPKYTALRELLSHHLQPGETLPEPPARNSVITFPPVELKETAPVFANLPSPLHDTEARTMEKYDQGMGCILYRTTLPAGPAATLSVKEAHDFGWVFVDGKEIGRLDRRLDLHSVPLPERTAPVTLDILIEAVGRINFGTAAHDRKGIIGPVQVTDAAGEGTLADWQIYRLPLDATQLAGLKWQTFSTKAQPAFWRGEFTLEKPGDTFLDVRDWGKGVVWVNGHCLGRFWNIGPTQTMYLPGPWLKAGKNEVVVLDLLGPFKPQLAGLAEPILNQVRPQLDLSSPAPGK